MGMTIEEKFKILQNEYTHLMGKYQMMQADYEIRLKAEKVDMLKELQLEIEEFDSRAGYDGNGMPTFSTDYIRKKKVNELIQQKINALGGDENA